MAFASLSRRRFLSALVLLGAAAPAASLARIRLSRLRSPARIVIAGGGSAGLNIAARLCRMLESPHVLIIDPSTTHYFQPGFTLVAAGELSPSSICRPQRSLIPHGARWLPDSIVEFDPDHQRVFTSHHGAIPYDFLLLTPGIELHYHLIEGLRLDHLGRNGLHSLYHFPSACACFSALQQLARAGGRALFTDTFTKIKCGGVPKKINLIAEHYCRLQGARARTEFAFFSNHKELFEVPFFRRRLEEIYAERGIAIHTQYRVKALHPDLRRVTLQQYETLPGAAAPRVLATVEEPYDFLHLVPPMSAPSVVRHSPFCLDPSSSRPADWIPTHPETLIHPRYANVLVAGDAAALPTSKTGAAIRVQAPVAAANLLSLIAGKEPAARYNGYTACPIVTGYGRVLLAEFDYRKQPTPTLPFVDAAREHAAAWLLKRHVLKPLYFEAMLRGLA